MLCACDICVLTDPPGASPVRVLAVRPQSISSQQARLQHLAGQAARQRAERQCEAAVFLFAGEDDLMIGARKGSPLAVGHGDGEMYLGSDAIALAPLTDRITYLDEGDWAVITRAGAQIFDAQGRRANRPLRCRCSAGNAAVSVSCGRHRRQRSTGRGKCSHRTSTPESRRRESSAERGSTPSARWTTRSSYLDGT